MNFNTLKIDYNNGLILSRLESGVIQKDILLELDMEDAIRIVQKMYSSLLSGDVQYNLSVSKYDISIAAYGHGKISVIIMERVGARYKPIASLQYSRYVSYDSLLDGIHTALINMQMDTIYTATC